MLDAKSVDKQLSNSLTKFCAKGRRLVVSDRLVLHPAEVREYIGKLTGACQILNSFPGYLKGENDYSQSAYLTKQELGNHEIFFTAWKEICDSRIRESTQIAHFMKSNRDKLVKGAARIAHQDMDAAAIFPYTTDPVDHTKTSLETSVERHGVDVRSHDEDLVDKYGHNIPE